MGNLQKKRRTTGKKALAYRGKSGQNTGNDFLALGLGVVLYLLNTHTLVDASDFFFLLGEASKNPAWFQEPLRSSLEGQFGGFRVQGAQKRSSGRAAESG